MGEGAGRQDLLKLPGDSSVQAGLRTTAVFRSGFSGFFNGIE